MILDENLLIEAYSESMPSWLKEILRTSATRGMLNNRRVYNTYNLLGNLLRAGVDVSSANFLTPGIPTSSRDANLKPPYIAIFLIEVNGSLYFVARNTSTSLNDDKVEDDKGQLIPVKYLSDKFLTTHAKEFCNVIPNTVVDDKRSTRSKIVSDIDITQEKVDDYPQKSRIGLKLRNNISSGKMVKDLQTGKLVNPNKYEDALRKLHENEVLRELDKAYDIINQEQEALINELENASLSQSVSTIYNAFDRINNFKYDYNRHVRDLQDDLSRYGQIDSWTRDRISNFTKMVKNYHNNESPYAEVDWE